MKILKEMMFSFNLFYLYFNEDKIFHLKIGNIDIGTLDTSLLEIFINDIEMHWDVFYFWAIYNMICDWIDGLRNRGILS
jgi:hypothetical protein